MQRILQSRLVQNFWRYAGAVSIRMKVLGIVVGVIVGLSSFVILQMRTVLLDTLTDSLEQQGIALANNIAQDAGDSLTTTDNIAMPIDLLLFERKAHYSTESHNTSVNYIVVQDGTGDIISSEGAVPASAQQIDQEHGQQHPVFLVEGGHTVEVQSPIPGTDYLLRLGLSRSDIEDTVNQVTLQLLLITGVMIVVGFAAALFLTWILTRPILDLVNATHAVATGDFSRRVPRWADDEIGELATAFNHMTAALQQAEQERHEREKMREQYINGVILAQENERQRIARELHDSTSQSLTSVLVSLQNLKQSYSNRNIDSSVDDLRQIIVSTLEEIRAISWRLRPSVLDDMGLASALENYINDYQDRYQIPVELVIRGLDQRLPSEIETTIYRIIQEALTNVARYAQAESVSLVVTCRDGMLKIIIEDDGIGFDPLTVQRNKKTLGLQGIRERTGLFGGSFAIESSPGHGTSLFIEMPCTTEFRTG